MGINNETFCKPEPPAYMRSTANGYFLTPVVQAHHVEFSPDFLEIATATGLYACSFLKVVYKVFYTGY